MKQQTRFVLTERQPQYPSLRVQAVHGFKRLKSNSKILPLQIPEGHPIDSETAGNLADVDKVPLIGVRVKRKIAFVPSHSAHRVHRKVIVVGTPRACTGNSPLGILANADAKSCLLQNRNPEIRCKSRKQALGFSIIRTHFIPLLYQAFGNGKQLIFQRQGIVLIIITQENDSFALRSRLRILEKLTVGLRNSVFPAVLAVSHIELGAKLKIRLPRRFLRLLRRLEKNAARIRPGFLPQITRCLPEKLIAVSRRDRDRQPLGSGRISENSFLRNFHLIPL